MADDRSTTQPQPPQPDPDLRRLDRLLGTWNVSGGAQGRVTYEWMEGGFFLLQHVELEQDGQKVRGIEIIGHERQFGAEPSQEITSGTPRLRVRATGAIPHDLGRREGSPAYSQGRFGDDGRHRHRRLAVSGWRLSLDRDQAGRWHR